MKTKILFLSLLISGSPITASEPLLVHQEQHLISLKTHFDICRNFIDELHHHDRVLNKYDQFALALHNSYLAGEGFIEQDIHRILNALTFAAEKHRLQKRKDPQQTPYIIHPIGVAHTLLTLGHVRDPDILMGALLHDTVEDTDTSFAELEQAFGSRVTGFVREVTDDKSLPKATRKLLQIEHAPHKSAGAAQIKLSDKLYNLTDLSQTPPPHWSQERIDAYFHWAHAVTSALPWVNSALKAAVDDIIDTHLNEN